MLNKTPDEHLSGAPDPVPAVTITGAHAAADASAVQAIVDVLKGSPQFQTMVSPEFSVSPEFTSVSPEFDEYLTSPWESPFYEYMLDTPAMPSADLSADILTSPAVPEDEFGLDGAFADMPLFGVSVGASDSMMEYSKIHFDGPMSAFDGLYTMSPCTPSINPASLFPSPHMPTSDSPSTASSAIVRPKNGPTGTRKNVTPATLIPVDAPIQPRSYVTPSATSRKVLPALFQKKRSRSQAFVDEDDDELEDPSAAVPTTAEEAAIAAKRRQNTIAARRSRKRKLEYQQQLEDALDSEKREKEEWKGRALTCRALLVSHGIEPPVFN